MDELSSRASNRRSGDVWLTEELGDRLVPRRERGFFLTTLPFLVTSAGPLHENDRAVRGDIHV